MEQTTKTHEIIHLHQQRELWLIGFYFLYVFYWVRGIARGKNSHDAYMDIPFEKEAYANEGNKIYPMLRERNAWKKYL